jgi:hypothetical protein
MNIYLAGPLFSVAERAFLDGVAARLRGAGYEVFVPHEQISEQLSVSAEEVYRVDLAGLKGANAVLAWIDGPVIDDGTAVEIGIFTQLVASDPVRWRGIVAIATDLRLHRRRGVLPGDGVNLFAAGAIRSVGEIVWSVDEALAALTRLASRM